MRIIAAVYTCPSCATKLAGIEVGESATVVASRTCRKCGDRWQIICTPLKVEAEKRFDRGVFTFLDNRYTRRRLNGGAR
jgi:hypothetical protein